MAELSAEALESCSGILHCRIDDRVKDLASNKEVPVANLITRHVKQVTDFNKALEKRRLWRKREKELERKHEDTWGVLRSEGRAQAPREAPAIPSSAKRVLDAIKVEGIDKEVVEKVKEKVARQFGSVDVHAATRQRAAREKEKLQLQRQESASDAWLPDRFYTEELKQKTPWLNPVEFLSGLQLSKSEGSLTPVASDSESEASRRKKKKKKRKKEKKKQKKHKKKRRE